MIELLLRLRERKLVQWGLAYLAAAWLLLQVLALLAATYAWPAIIMRSLPILLAAGFFAILVIAWNHGERGRQRVTGLELIVIAAIFATAAVGIAWIYDGGGVVAAGTGDAAAPDPRSIAVLPFVNAAADPDQEYFADGIAEEILDALAQVPGIRAAARTSSFHYKGRSVPIREIARELSVAAVLEGSVRRDGDRLRISVRLADAADRQLWARAFDRQVGDAFAIQTEIARTVVEALASNLPSGHAADRAVATPGAEAHDLFLQGLFYWNRRTTLHMRRAVDMFEQAIRLEPGYARAHSGLALAWSVIHHYAPDIDAAAALARAEANALRALELDPQLADAHAALGYTYYWLWRWQDALEQLERAIALNPNHSTARQWYGELLAQLGRATDAEAQLRHAVALDPLSLAAHGNLGLILMINRRMPEAIAQLEATTRMDPGFAFPLLLLHKSYLQVGRLDDSRSAGRRWAEVTGAVDPDDIVTLVDAIADPSRRSAGRDVLRRWERSAATNWVEVAFYYLKLGETDAAIDALDRAVQERAPFLNGLHVGAVWDPLRDHPRFQRIHRELGFPASGA